MEGALRLSVLMSAAAAIIIIALSLPAPVKAAGFCAATPGAQYTLSIVNSGLGTVNKAPYKDYYNSDDTVQLTAIPSSGWSFSGWSGDLTGYDNPANIVIDANKRIFANFVHNLWSAHYSLTIKINGNGNVAVYPYNTVYYLGDVVRLTALPGDGWRFNGWSGDLSSNLISDNVTINADTTVTVNFVVKGFPSAGAGGGTDTPQPAGAPVNLIGLSSSPDLVADQAGISKLGASLKDPENKISLEIKPGTSLKGPNDDVLKVLAASIPDSLPAPPQNAAILGDYYLGQQGARFNPDLALTVKYSPQDVPAAASEAGLYLAFWDGAGWVNLKSQVDTSARTVTAPINHFSGICLAGRPSLSG